MFKILASSSLAVEVQGTIDHHKNKCDKTGEYHGQKAKEKMLRQGEERRRKTLQQMPQSISSFM